MASTKSPLALRLQRLVLPVVPVLVLAVTAVTALGVLPAWLGLVIAVAIVALAAILLGSLAGHRSMEILFLAFIFLMPATRFSVLESSFSLQANFLLIAAVGLLLVWRAGILQRPLRIPRSRVHLAVLLLFAVVAFSFFLSVQVPAGEFRGEVRFVRSTKQIVFLAFMLITYATVLLVVRDRRMFRRAVWAYVTATVVVSLYGLYQFVGYPLGLPFIDLFPDTASFGQSAVYAIPLAGGRFLRVWSVASEPTWFGDYMVGAIPVVAALALSRAALGRRKRLFLYAALTVMLLALLLTFTRSAYMAIVVSAVVLVAFRPKLLVTGTAAAVLVAVILLLSDVLITRLPMLEEASLLTAATERLTSVFEQDYFGNVHRATAAVSSLNMFLDRPWGVGYGNYGFFFANYTPLWGRAWTDTHIYEFPVMTGGMLLRLLTEAGIPGAFAFLFLIVMVSREAINAARRLRGEPFLQAATIGLLAGFLGLMFRLIFFDSSIHFTYQWFLMAMIVAANWLSRQEATEASSPEPVE